MEPPAARPPESPVPSPEPEPSVTPEPPPTPLYDWRNDPEIHEAILADWEVGERLIAIRGVPPSPPLVPEYGYFP